MLDAWFCSHLALTPLRRRSVGHARTPFAPPPLKRWATPAAAIACLFGAAAIAAGDEIRTVKQARYPSVRIEDVQDGRLSFRDVQGRVLERPIAEIASLDITGWEAFNRAEAALSEKQYRQAAREFETILRAVEQAGPDAGRPRHRRELVLERLLLAADGEGRFDRAMECYILLCKAWGTAAAGLGPRNIPARESAFYTTATARLSAAITDAGQTPAGEQLRRYEAQLKGQPATQPATRPTAVAPAPRPDRHTPKRAPEPDSRLTQVGKLVEAGQFDRAMPVIEDSLRSRPVETLAAWYYWQGRCLEGPAKDDAARMRAALAYMRIPAHYPADPLCAECLYRVAMIHKRTGRTERVALLLQEALRHAPSDEIKRECETALQEVRK